MVVNDFESTLITALQDEADQKTRTLDTVTAARRLEARFERIDRNRHLQTWGTAVTAVAAAVLVLAIALIVNPTPNARVEPAGIPGEVFAPDPFLSNHQASVWAPRIRLINTTPPRLDQCLPDPRTWGALKTQAATYHDPHPDRVIRDTRMNEYLLQYADASERTPSLPPGVPAGQGLRSR